VHFVSEVLDCPPEEIRAGMTVEAVFVPASDEITLVKFRRSDPRLRPGSGTDSEGAARWTDGNRVPRPAKPARQTSRIVNRDWTRSVCRAAQADCASVSGAPWFAAPASPAAA